LALEKHDAVFVSNLILINSIDAGLELLELLLGFLGACIGGVSLSTESGEFLWSEKIVMGSC
jgi:hypothetical protein